MTARVVCLGAHILDVLGRPVSDIPPGQGRRVLDEIRLTAAGTAGGTAVDLAKLGAQVVSVGPIGDDTTGRLLVELLTEPGVDPSGLVRKPGLATPCTILPIRPNGERPALHAPGAMTALAAGDVDPTVVAAADVLHVGGPDVLGAFGVTEVPGLLRLARDNGTVTTMDLLSWPRDGLIEELTPAFEHTRYFLPNDDQIRALTGESDLRAAAEVIRARGVETVIVTMGAAGSLVCTGDGAVRVPAFDVSVVDTTGCGDGFSAGLITGLCQGWDLLDAVSLGTAAGALVAGGLGSDAGIVDFPTTVEFLASSTSEGR